MVWYAEKSEHKANLTLKNIVALAKGEWVWDPECSCHEEVVETQNSTVGTNGEYEKITRYSCRSGYYMQNATHLSECREGTHTEGKAWVLECEKWNPETQKNEPCYCLKDFENSTVTNFCGHDEHSHWVWRND